MAKKKFNVEEKKALRAGELSLFLKQYGRKAQRGVEPNDRQFKHETALKLKKHLKPTEMDELLREEDG